MSAYLLGVGFKAEMGSGPRKLVLLKMIDACEDDGTRIFPAISTLARAAECSGRTVQREIKLFLDHGLISLVREGGRGPRSTNEYRLNLNALYRIAEVGWDAYVGAKPGGKEAGDAGNKGGTVSPLEKGKGDTGDTLRVTPGADKGDTSCHTTPPDSSLDPSDARECASAAAGAPDGAGEEGSRSAKQVDRMFWKLVKDWPDLRGMPKQRAQAAFEKLSEADQDAALAKRDQWFALLRSQDKDHTPAPSTYLAEKLWQDVPDDFGKPASKAESARVPPYGKAWGAARFADLMRPAYGPAVKLNRLDERLIADGKVDRDAVLNRKRANCGWPVVNGMQERAAHGHKGVTADPALAPLVELFDKVLVGGEIWRAWRDLHEERGWPWFGSEVHLPDWIYFPSVPDGNHTSALEGVRAAMTRFENVHETLRPKDAAE